MDERGGRNGEEEEWMERNWKLKLKATNIFRRQRAAGQRNEGDTEICIMIMQITYPWELGRFVSSLFYLFRLIFDLLFVRPFNVLFTQFHIQLRVFLFFLFFSFYFLRRAAGGGGGASHGNTKSLLRRWEMKSLCFLFPFYSDIARRCFVHAPHSLIVEKRVLDYRDSGGNFKLFVDDFNPPPRALCLVRRSVSGGEETWKRKLNQTASGDGREVFFTTVALEHLQNTPTTIRRVVEEKEKLRALVEWCV